MVIRTTCFVFISALILALGCPGEGRAQSIPPEPAAVLDYAHLLYEEGDLFRAAGEAKRFLFFHPGHPRAPEVRDLLQKVEARMSENGRSQPEDDFDPWRWSRYGEAGKRDGALVGLVRFYQDHLRTFKRPGSSCPSYPNCSRYAIQAIKKHGGILGTFIYVDRFWREVTTAGKPEFYTLNGKKLHYDPLEANDYWLSSGTGSDEIFEIP